MRKILYATLLMFAACNQKKNQEKQTASTDYSTIEVQQQIKAEDISKHLSSLLKAFTILLKRTSTVFYLGRLKAF